MAALCLIRTQKWDRLSVHSLCESPLRCGVVLTCSLYLPSGKWPWFPGHLCKSVRGVVRARAKGCSTEKVHQCEGGHKHNTHTHTLSYVTPFYSSESDASRTHSDCSDCNNPQSVCEGVQVCRASRPSGQGENIQPGREQKSMLL